MTASPTAPRRRLTRSADFDAVYRRGRSRSSRHLVVWLFPRADSDAEPMRLGITVPRKVGTAIVRNRVKRQLRDAVAAAPTSQLVGSDVVLVARGGISEAIELGGFAWLVGELGALLSPEPEAQP